MTTIDDVSFELNRLISALQLKDSKHVTFEREDVLGICEFTEKLIAQNKQLTRAIEEISKL